jgi:hypothetical protein
MQHPLCSTKKIRSGQKYQCFFPVWWGISLSALSALSALFAWAIYNNLPLIHTPSPCSYSEPELIPWSHTLHQLLLFSQGKCFISLVWSYKSRHAEKQILSLYCISLVKTSWLRLKICKHNLYYCHSNKQMSIICFFYVPRTMTQSPRYKSNWHLIAFNLIPYHGYSQNAFTLLEERMNVHKLVLVEKLSWKMWLQMLMHMIYWVVWIQVDKCHGILAPCGLCMWWWEERLPKVMKHKDKVLLILGNALEDIIRNSLTNTENTHEGVL